MSVVLALATIAGCGDDQPDVFASREQLPACGSFPDRRPDAPLTAAEQNGLDCVRAALAAGTGAELSYAFLTTEGAPVRYWLRVLPGGAVEMYEHSSDTNGPSGWTRYTSCTITEAELATPPLPGPCASSARL
jgi:hypothetical protein